MIELTGKKVLVTGASGFIGKVLTRELLRAGTEVHGISRLPDEGDSGGIVWWGGDCTDYDFVRETVGSCRPEIVFHLAGYVYGKRDIDSVLPSLHGNLTTTVNLLTSLGEEGCEKVVLAGSLEEPDRGSTEAPSSPYAAAKWACDTYARLFYQLYQVPVVNPRIFMVYGPGHWEKKKLVPYLVNAFLENEETKLTGGTRKVDWVYVDDVVNGLLACARSGIVDGSRVDIGTGSLFSVREVAEILCDLIRPATKPVFGAAPDRPFEQVRAAAAADAKRRIGWNAEVSLRDGLARTVDWYRQNRRGAPGKLQ